MRFSLNIFLFYSKYIFIVKFLFTINKLNFFFFILAFLNYKCNNNKKKRENIQKLFIITLYEPHFVNGICFCLRVCSIEKTQINLLFFLHMC